MDDEGEQKKKRKCVHHHHRRRRRKSSSIDRLTSNSIPIFTDEFLHLFGKQKCEIRSLKMRLNQLNDELKFKDAEQEQIRLNNKKMRRDFEEISLENSFLRNRIEQIENEFLNEFHLKTKENLFQLINDRHDEEDFSSKLSQIVLRLNL